MKDARSRRPRNWGAWYCAVFAVWGGPHSTTPDVLCANPESEKVVRFGRDNINHVGGTDRACNVTPLRHFFIVVITPSPPLLPLFVLDSLADWHA